MTRQSFLIGHFYSRRTRGLAWMYPSPLAWSVTLQPTFQFRGPPTCYNGMNGSCCIQNENQTTATERYTSFLPPSYLLLLLFFFASFLEKKRFWEQAMFQTHLTQKIHIKYFSWIRATVYEYGVYQNVNRKKFEENFLFGKWSQTWLKSCCSFTSLYNTLLKGFMS